ncbi:MMPL family transporter [Kribbella sp. NPDC048915]|uniref:MMPL family transporter n=1 Tax=Kribbella sp. NPDC048915 TaxID=3155148 RepID=UPI0033E1834C
MIRWPRLILDTAIVVLVTAAIFAAGVMGKLSEGGYSDPASESARELAAERSHFGNWSVDVIAIYSSDTQTAQDAGFVAAVRSVVDGLPDDLVDTVVPYYDDRTPSAGLVSTDGRAAQVLISLAGDDQDDFIKNYDSLRPYLVADGLRLDLAGNYAVYSDVNTITAEDLARAELVSLPLVVILALFIFGSVTAALMPALVGLAATVGALAMVRVIAGPTEVSVFSVNVVTLLGIGLAVDYALFVVSRFREELAVDADVERALRVTLGTAGRTVLVSGATVSLALSSLLLFPQTFIRSVAYGGIAAVLVAMAATLVLLPAVLRLLGPRINWGRIRLPRSRTRQPWVRIARTVMRRPVVTVVSLGAVLILAAVPLLDARWAGVDHHVLPPTAPAHVAAERLRDFGPESSTANVLLQRMDDQHATAYIDELGAIPGVRSVEVLTKQDDTQLLRITWLGESQSERSQELVRAVRGLRPASGEVLVGGLTADTVDLVDSIGSRLPWMGLYVVGAMAILLFLAFGSLLLPLKAVAMNLLSLGASFGVVAWIFVDGRLTDALGYRPQGFLDATNPVLMLAVLIGLSMDYELFLLSRIREEWNRTGDNNHAVLAGVRSTGRIITSAALLLAVVIGAFATSGLVFMKELGIGMLVALLVDATIVRLLLVPASMTLLGRWNWWAPLRLTRWWLRYGLKDAAPVTPRQDSPSAEGESVDVVAYRRR